jgi:hypothetical protein
LIITFVQDPNSGAGSPGDFPAHPERGYWVWWRWGSPPAVPHQQPACRLPHSTQHPHFQNREAAEVIREKPSCCLTLCSRVTKRLAHLQNRKSAEKIREKPSCCLTLLKSDQEAHLQNQKTAEKSAKNLHVASPYTRVTRPSPPKSENRIKNVVLPTEKNNYEIQLSSLKSVRCMRSRYIQGAGKSH